ncbi:hypothetical protein L798_09961 [Zootermopsis nevadensis]|uniref:Uncharacterized protein n=1 Tax=Zootermopsis nevadensis TaxID=136037 RepID=A0A067RA24_ZOONE|nr:hypothetical protein L798_09961 [Zootermopsis nevadensis]
MQIALSTRLLIRERNKLRTTWQRTHNVALRPRINPLKHQIDAAIKNQLNDTWQHTLQGLDTSNNGDIWRITKSLTNSTTYIPPLKFNGRSPVTHDEKVTLFADTLQDIFTTDTDLDPDFTQQTEHTVRDFR